MRMVIDSVEGEFRRYKKLAEASFEQLADTELTVRPTDGNSVASLARHVGGNLASRFTDFLTTDGEKPWRDRESEFADRSATREELLDVWQKGWQALFSTLSSLSDSQLDQQVTIRGESLSALQALHRSLAHTSYHVGQIVFIAKGMRGDAWRYLSIPPAGHVSQSS